MLQVNDPALRSWISVSADSDFPIQNIPFGICKPEGKAPRVATIIGDSVIDLAMLAQEGYFSNINVDHSVFQQPYLNDFIALGKAITRAVRLRISELFRVDNTTLAGNSDVLAKILYNVEEVEVLLPVRVGDYTDFYASKEHAYNVGCLFRDPKNALMPNWLHIPIGYHGRSSSIIASGTPVRRPIGQSRPAEGTNTPGFGPSKLLDFELEMAFITTDVNVLGERIAIEAAEDNIFGLVLFNDWSARDIQAWEYQPLGPFLGKSFASTISPWIVTLDALEPFRTESPKQDPTPLPYLQMEGNQSFDIKLQAAIQPEGGEETIVTNSNFKYMYWTMAQQLTHHTVNGCNVRAGDMMGSGTISGPTEDSYGSMLELTWRGSKPLTMKDGTERKFINDHDTVILRGWGEANGVRIGFGECTGKLLPAL